MLNTKIGQNFYKTNVSKSNVNKNNMNFKKMITNMLYDLNGKDKIDQVYVAKGKLQTILNGASTAAENGEVVVNVEPKKKKMVVIMPNGNGEQNVEFNEINSRLNKLMPKNKGINTNLIVDFYNYFLGNRYLCP